MSFSKSEKLYNIITVGLVVVFAWQVVVWTTLLYAVSWGKVRAWAKTEHDDWEWVLYCFKNSDDMLEAMSRPDER